jgi:hypothetical protein
MNSDSKTVLRWTVFGLASFSAFVYLTADIPKSSASVERKDSAPVAAPAPPPKPDTTEFKLTESEFKDAATRTCLETFEREGGGGTIHDIQSFETDDGSAISVRVDHGYPSERWVGLYRRSGSECKPILSLSKDVVNTFDTEDPLP